MTIATAIPPIAIVNGQAMTDLPTDLYIPPDAMKVFLEAFEGPLDLLLYLIRKQNLDILDIPIAKITEQYMEYVDYIKVFSLDLAAEYLVMAAILAEIKSRLLLPKPEAAAQPEEDPRALLIRRLQEYERYKQAALAINDLPRIERDIFTLAIHHEPLDLPVRLPTISLQDLILAFAGVLKRIEFSENHLITLEAISVREKMTYILETIQTTPHCLFTTLFNLTTEGRRGVIVTFLAMLELAKEGLIEFIQTTVFGPIYLTPARAGINT